MMAGLLPSSGLAQPQTVAIRPLLSGMMTDKAMTEMPTGAFLDLCGYDVRGRGPRRVDGNVLLLPGPLTFWNADEIATDIVGFWGDEDKQYNAVITNRGLYKVEYASQTEFCTPVWWQRDYVVSGYVSGTGVLTATVDMEDDSVRVGDYVVLDADLTTRYAITAVSTTTVTIATGLTISASDGFKIYREFACEAPYYVDYAFFARATIARMIIVDGTDGGIYAYDGGFLTPWALVDDSDIASYTGARTVTYFGGHLYFGCVTLLGNTYRNRIIWSDALDLHKISATNYQDLTETAGQILKLCGLGSLIFCYMNDSAYYGRETNLTGTPYSFVKLDTGNVGLAGMRAVVPFIDGQVFVSSDEIYYVTASEGISALGAPVLAESVKRAMAAGSLDRTMICMDTPRQRLLFLYSLNGTDTLDTLFIFDYVTKAWSRAEIAPVTAMRVVNLADEMEYDDISVDATYDDYADVAYAAMGGSFAERQLVSVDSLQYARVLEENSTAFVDTAGESVPIRCVIETGDFDFDAPDTDKSSLELRMKLKDSEVDRTSAITFSVAGSVDEGYSWKNFGQLRIPPTKHEGAVTVRMIGSKLRYRLISTSIVEPYEISEMTLRAVIRGKEANRGGTTSNP